MRVFQKHLFLFQAILFKTHAVKVLIATELVIKQREKSGGVRHGPQRVMGKNITDVHFTLDTME